MAPPTEAQKIPRLSAQRIEAQSCGYVSTGSHSRSFGAQEQRYVERIGSPA